MTLSKVLETFAVTGKSTTVVEQIAEGKIRVTSLSWAEPKVPFKGEILEIRSIDGRIRVAHKPRLHDEDDLPVQPYGPVRAWHQSRRSWSGH
jgi:hypothetical protein